MIGNWLKKNCLRNLHLTGQNKGRKGKGKAQDLLKDLMARPRAPPARSPTSTSSSVASGSSPSTPPPQPLPPTTPRDVEYKIGDRITWVDAKKTPFHGVIEEVFPTKYEIVWDLDGTISVLGRSSRDRMSHFGFAPAVAKNISFDSETLKKVAPPKKESTKKEKQGKKRKVFSVDDEDEDEDEDDGDDEDENDGGDDGDDDDEGEDTKTSKSKQKFAIVRQDVDGDGTEWFTRIRSVGGCFTTTKKAKSYLLKLIKQKDLHLITKNNQYDNFDFSKHARKEEKNFVQYVESRDRLKGYKFEIIEI